jgi:hypothetical protein
MLLDGGFFSGVYGYAEDAHPGVLECNPVILWGGAYAVLRIGRAGQHAPDRNEKWPSGHGSPGDVAATL